MRLDSTESNRRSDRIGKQIHDILQRLNGRLGHDEGTAVDGDLARLFDLQKQQIKEGRAGMTMAEHQAIISGLHDEMVRLVTVVDDAIDGWEGEKCPEVVHLRKIKGQIANRYMAQIENRSVSMLVQHGKLPDELIGGEKTGNEKSAG